MRRKHKSAAFGYSLIELAIVAPILFFAAFAAFDINSILQARSVAKQSVSNALRRCYPTDGGCFNYINTSSTANFYDWSCGEKNIKYAYPEIDYWLVKARLEAPVYALSDFRARLYKTVVADIPQSIYRATKSQASVSAEFRYLLMDPVFPYISGDPRSPKFQKSRTEATPVLPMEASRASVKNTAHKSLHLDGKSGKNNADNQSKPQVVARFTIKKPNLVSSSGKQYQTLPCYTTVLSSTNMQTKKDLSCSSGFLSAFSLPSSQSNTVTSEHYRDLNDNQISTESTYIVLHVKGDTRGTNNNSCGRATLSLRLADGNNERDLGGQVFRGANGNSNFYPRGLPWKSDYIDSRYIEPSAPDFKLEFKNHQAILVEYDQTYEILIGLNRLSSISEIDSDGKTRNVSCDNGDVTYSYSDVDIYGPSFSVQSGMVSCENKITPGTSTQPGFNCTQKTFPAKYINVLSGAYSEETTDSVLFERPFYSEQQAKSSLLSVSSYDTSMGLASFQIQRISEGPISSVSASCPPSNCGTAQRPDGNGYVGDSSEARTECPTALVENTLTPEQRKADGTISYKWTVDADGSFTPILNVPITTWTKSSCEQTLTDIKSVIPALSCYRDLTWSSSLSSHTPVNTGTPDLRLSYNADPSSPAFQKTQPKYSCNEFILSECVLDEGPDSLKPPSSAPSKPTGLNACKDKNGALVSTHNSLFYGLHPLTISLKNEWQQTLTSQAKSIDNAILLSDYLWPDMATANIKEVQADSLGLPSGVEITPIELPALNVTQLPGGPFSEDYVPPQVSDAHYSCFRSVNPEARRNASLSFDNRQALADAYGTVTSALPWSKTQCHGPSCVNVSVSQENASGSQQFVKASTTIEVPLLFISKLIPLGEQKSISISYSDQERWEGRFAQSIR